MSKSYFFISGLPRSGSTLLCNIFCQHPDFYASATSGVLDIMFGVRNSWDNQIEHQSNPNKLALDDAKKNVLKGILTNYYDVLAPDAKVVFDKSRGWTNYIEMIDTVLDQDIKVIVPVRDPRDVLASFENLYRKTSKKPAQFGGEAENYFAFQTIEGRCKTWASGDQAFGLAYNRVKDAFDRGHKDKMLFVDFKELTQHKQTTMDRIHNFLGLDNFTYDFNNVEQVTVEDDSIHGIADLHTIRPKVEYPGPRWPDFIPDRVADAYKDLDFWRDFV